MNTLSLTFLCAYLLVLLIYWIIPDRYRNIFLLICSLMYMTTWDYRYTLILCVEIIFTWCIGKYMYRKKPVIYLAIGIITLVLVLVVSKYTDFGLKVLGISFFTFQEISYLIDVYRRDVEPEHSIVNYALYVSFFPQLLSGPIAKAKEQLQRYRAKKVYNIESMEKGWITALYGVFLKMVIADRIAIYVNKVYGTYGGNLDGTVRIGTIAMVLAVVLYAVQIYCDFAGYTLIAIGIAQTFGIELPINFKQPYLASGITDFWKRWHISLTSWFRDYLYIPLGGNRKGIVRTYANILIVFIVSGVWHGAGITFIIWGALHGLLQVIEKMWKRFRSNSPKHHNIDVSSVKGNRVQSEKIFNFIKCIFRRGFTFLLVSITWVFFRAEDIHQAIWILKEICMGRGTASILGFGLDKWNMILLLVCIMVLFIIDIAKERGYNVVSYIMNCKLPVRWFILYVLIFSIIIFGIYGPGYDASAFIYYKF